MGRQVGWEKRLIRSLAAAAAIAGLTFGFSRIISVNSTTVSLSFLLVVLAIATGWGLYEAIVASIAGVLCFNFFFLPPIGDFTIADPQNWVALLAFLVTSIVASQLSARAKNRAMEATRRQHEMERLYELSRSLLLLDNKALTAGQLPFQIARVFGFPAVAVFDRASGETHRAGPSEISVSDARMRDAAAQGTASYDPESGVSVLPVTLGGAAVGSLAVIVESVSEPALHAIANLTAITMERARAQEAAGLAEVARQSEELKSTLLDALAHEFKTPLTSIKAAASALLATGESAEKELLTIVKEEVDRLGSLVTEAIQVARIEAGKLSLERQPEAIGDLVSLALGRMAPLLEKRRVLIEISEGLPAVLIDRELVGVVIRQLLHNAVKYSPQDGPIVIRAFAQSGMVALCVDDSGPGIPEGERENVFRKFYRIPERSGPVPGTGMGLAIAREIVEAHGGKIWAESHSAGGARFVFTMPRALTESAT